MHTTASVQNLQRTTTTFPGEECGNNSKIIFMTQAELLLFNFCMSSDELAAAQYAHLRALY